MKKRLQLLLVQFWRPLLIGLAIAIITFVVLFNHLGKRPPALSAPEVVTRHASSSLHVISHNPVNAPLTLPEHYFMVVRPHGIAASRAVPAIFGVITLVLLFIILRFWQDTYTAILGTAMFGTSSWFLHTVRLDTPDALMFGLVALMAACLWLKHTLRRNLIALVCAITIGLALYVPGLIWFLAIGAAFYHRAIIHELKHTKLATKIIAAVLLLLIIAPLVIAIVRQPSITWAVVGLPSHFSKPLHIVHNLADIPLQLFVRYPFSPVHWLGRLPILDIFTDVMLALGVYSFWQHRKLYRARLLFGAAVIGAILISFGGPVTITILIPLIYILVAAGLLYMIESWQTVFPRNPVARGVGTVFLILAVAISCSFQLHSYFVAWQNAPATKTVFIYPATDVVSGKP